MTYVLVTDRNTVASRPFPSYDRAYKAAVSRFGEDVGKWLSLNLRIEENR